MQSFLTCCPLRLCCCVKAGQCVSHSVAYIKPAGCLCFTWAMHASATLLKAFCSSASGSLMAVRMPGTHSC